MLVPCVQVDMLSHAVWFPKIQRNGPTLTSPPPPPYTQTHRQTLSAGTEKAQADTPCMLLPVTRACFCGFTGSFTPPCHASPHRMPLNTGSLCGHSTAWEGPPATHHTVFIYVYISNLTSDLLSGGKCIYSVTYQNFAYMLLIAPFLFHYIKLFLFDTKFAL